MKTVEVKGTIESAYGKPVTEYGKQPIPYAGTVENYETIEEIKTANDWPSNDEILSIVNQRKTAAGRAKAIKAALDAAGIEKPTLEDKDEAVKATVKILMAQGKDEATARQLAEALIRG